MILDTLNHKVEADVGSCDKSVFRVAEVVKIPTSDSVNFVRWVNKGVSHRTSRSLFIFFLSVHLEAVVF